MSFFCYTLTLILSIGTQRRKSVRLLLQPQGVLSHDRAIAFAVTLAPFTTGLFCFHTLASTALPGKLNCSGNTLMVYAVSLVAFFSLKSGNKKQPKTEII